jgi:hypothetical protein
MDKPLKLTGDLQYMFPVCPVMLEYLERGDGMKIGHTTNHHTVVLTLNTGKELTCHAYETKTMKHIQWG